LSPPDSGSVAIDEVDVAADPDAARARVGLLPETVGLYDRLTVREHLEYSAALHRLSAPDAAAAVNAVLEQLALAPLANRRARDLSMGQARRVALGRALVHSPRNVVLDEPTNGLDVLGARVVRHEIRRLAERGCAVLLSTHVMPEVAAVCDRIVILSRGRVVADGTPADMLDRTAVSTLEEAFVRMIGSEEGLN
jgi:sodium transport system ATP-binding protein